MSAFSSKSLWTTDTDNSTLVYAKTSLSSSYQFFNNISWSMWGAWAPGNNKPMFSLYEDASAALRCWHFSTQTDGTFRVIGSWDGTNICLFKTVNPVLDLSWHHIVVTFASGVFTVYVDNVAQSLTTVLPWGGGSTLYASTTVPVVIGNYDPLSGPNNDATCPGQYSNFSIWNKVLSTADITALYNNGQPGNLVNHPSYTNVKNWWRMDQSDTLPTLTDSISGANATIHKSGATPFFNQNTNVPLYYTDPGVGAVGAGSTYYFQGNLQTGTLNTVTNVLSNATLTGQSLNATLVQQ